MTLAWRSADQLLNHADDQVVSAESPVYDPGGIRLEPGDKPVPRPEILRVDSNRVQWVRVDKGEAPGLARRGVPGQPKLSVGGEASRPPNVVSEDWDSYGGEAAFYRCQAPDPSCQCFKCWTARKEAAVDQRRRHRAGFGLDEFAIMDDDDNPGGTSAMSGSAAGK